MLWRVVHGLPAIPFALLPLYAAFLAHSLSPPEPFEVLRPVFGITVVTLGACALLAGAGAKPMVAGGAVAAGALLLSLYPFVLRIFPLEESSIWLVGVAHVALSGIAVVFVVYTQPGPRAAIYSGLRIMAAVLFISMVANVNAAYRQVPDKHARVHSDLATRTLSPGAVQPDVYHLVLDGFGRDDVLRARYNLNVPLLAELRNRGFDVAEDRGFANYSQTALSLASMLNVGYLTDIDDHTVTSLSPLYSLIERNVVMAAFASMGYEIHFVGSVYSPTRSYEPATSCDCAQPFIGILEGTTLQFTPWRHIGVAGLDYRGYRNKIRQAFNAIEKIETSNRPRFLFAHIMAPHAPFVFDANGLDVVPRYTLSLEDGNSFPGTRDEYVEGYRNQATFIAARLIEVIDHLLSTSRASGRDPVIIVHGDHGPRLEFDTVDAAKTDSSESQPVLLAIRWSKTMPTSPRSVVSLVNVYRAVFDHYFAAGLDRLPDRAWVSSFRYPYQLIEVSVRGQ